MPSDEGDTFPALPDTSAEPESKSFATVVQRILSFYSLPQGLQYLVPLDLTAIWRRHLVWSKKDGDDLLKIVVARYSSTTVFLSLLVSAEFGVFYSPSSVCERVRVALSEDQYSLEYWTGVILALAITVAIGALVANFTAWQIFLVISKQNSPIILRSSMGLYAAQLPSRLVIAAIYSLFTWVGKFGFVECNVKLCLKGTLSDPIVFASS